MNGEQLPPDHGFPLRLIVPGWVGVASIKWVGQIEVANTTLSSPFNTTLYRLTGPDYPPDQPPLTTQAIKSAFELPLNAQLPAGRPSSWSGGRGRETQRSSGSTSASTAAFTGIARGCSARTCRTPGRAGLSRGLRGRRGRPAARPCNRPGPVSQPDTVPFNTGGYLFWASSSTRSPSHRRAFSIVHSRAGSDSDSLPVRVEKYPSSCSGALAATARSSRWSCSRTTARRSPGAYSSRSSSEARSRRAT